MPIDATIPPWPKQLSPRDFSDPQLVAPTLDAPAPLSGAPQTVMSGAGRWTMQMSYIPVFTDPATGRDNLAIWRALFTGRLQLGLPVLLPARDWRRGPVQRGSLAVDPALVPFSDTATFSDTTEFSSDYEDVKLTNAASVGDTSIMVDVDAAVAAAGGTPTGGDFISISQRLYLIVGAFPVDGVSNRFTWNVMPPLRFAADAGEIAEIRNPVCVMRLSTESRRAIAAQRDLGALARVSLTFVEDNWTI